MKTIKINEMQYRHLLGEHHHSFDEGLQDVSQEIARRLCSKYEKLSDGLLYDNVVDAFYQPIRAFDCDNWSYRIPVKVYDGECTMLEFPNNLIVGIEEIRKAVENNNTDYLSQLIYHEMGHLVNMKKSYDFHGMTKNSKKDFLTPLYLGMDNDEYKKIDRILYRFQARELRARCFETTMFIKLNRDKGITLQDVYDNRCSDITMMRNFVDTLKGIAQAGEENDTQKIISGLYRECVYEKNGKYGASWENKCRKVIYFFEQKLNWLKKRVDKIYYDFMHSGEL